MKTVLQFIGSSVNAGYHKRENRITEELNNRTTVQ